MAGQLGNKCVTRRDHWIAYAVMFGALLLGGVWQYHDVRHQCEENATNRTAIRDSLKRGFANLGYVWLDVRDEAVKVGPPPQQYYKDNPGEIPLQVERLRQELDGFPEIHC